MTRRINLNATIYSVRIHNVKTNNIINELAAKTSNRNAVINAMLDIAAPIYYAQVTGHTSQSEQHQSFAPSVGRELKELRRVLNDLYVAATVNQAMLAGLYNAKIAELEDDNVNPEELRDGTLCDIPPLVAELPSKLSGVVDEQ